MKRNVRSRLALLLALVLCVSNLSSVPGGISISFATEQSEGETGGTKEDGGTTKATDSDAPAPDDGNSDTCTCNELCTEDNVNASCPVCSKDIAG